MKKAIRVMGIGAMLPIMAAMVMTPGCGSDDFLGLEDYQRDLLTGGLLAAALLNQPATTDTTGGDEEPAPSPVDGRDGEDGLRCWDLDGDGIADPDEDANGDGDFTMLDCAGATGADGPAGQAGASGGDGVVGISCWDLNGNRSGDPAEDINGDGMFDANDCRGAQGPAGPPGSSGAAGSPGAPGVDGMSLFHLFVDDFFAAEGTYTAELPIVLVNIEEPALGQIPLVANGYVDAIAYRTPIPEIYHAGNDVRMRLYFYRTGPVEGDCFVFSLDARRLRQGSDIEVYGDTRWVRLDQLETDDADAQLLLGGTAELSGTLVVADMPINTAAGLGFPNDLAAADFLAFELRTHWRDGGRYQLLAVEFTEHRPGTAQRAGATVFSSEGSVTCDCNNNGIDDAVDIANGTSEDCNENNIPDECDIADGSADCNKNNIPDECDICRDDNGDTAAVRQLDADIEQAVVDGLAYLAARQNPDGSWSPDYDGQSAGEGGGECYRVAMTAMAVLKFEDRALDLGYLDPMNPNYQYSEQVFHGLAFITDPGYQHVIDISLEPQADGDGDGIGLLIKDCVEDHHDVYPTALTMMALASSRHPELYAGLVQDAMDWMVYAQNNADCGANRGGWGYGANDCGWSDNSNGGYASLGLGYAAASPPHGFGLTIPAFVLDELDLWIDALQDPVNGDETDGGSHYSPGGFWVNILKTGNLLYEMGMVGDTPAVERVQNALDYIERHWNDGPSCEPGWLGHRQAMFAMMKGLEGLNIDFLDLTGDGTADDDWFAPVATHLIDTQQADGSWPNDCWGDKVLSTAWALLTLERAVAPPRPTGACCHRNALACEDDVFAEDCLGTFDEWSEGVRCADLDPPCAPVACSPDCNENGVPDECELEGNDCQPNGVLDECDIAAGISDDEDENNIPDECEDQ